MPNFIGQAALTHIAEQYSKEIVMGAAYYNPAELDRLGITVISGVQFKNIKHVLNRKGHTTVRKTVGAEVNSNIGYIEERELVAYLSWNHYTDNEDNYREDAVFETEGSAVAHYPASELAVQAILANYAEDLFDNLQWGDAENGAAGMNLYDGFQTYLAKDIEKGRISTTRGNLVHIAAISAPASASDVAAWSAFKAFQQQWHPNMQNAVKVLVWCTPATSMAIATAYGNAHNNFQQVLWKENGNWTVPEYRNVEFVPTSGMGTGDRLEAMVPGNAEYGVDSDNSKSFVAVKFGTDKDVKDIQFQIQSIQGTRVLNVNPSKFIMTDGSLVAGAGFAGDYKKDSFEFGVNDSTLGTVTAAKGSTSLTSGDEVSANDTITLTAASKKSGSNDIADFVRWSNGSTANPLTVVAKGQPEYIVAIFKAKAAQ